jgi:hypothetical protein
MGTFVCICNPLNCNLNKRKMGSIEVFSLVSVKIVAFWVVTLWLQADTQISEEHAASIFRVEVCRFRN